MRSPATMTAAATTARNSPRPSRVARCWRHVAQASRRSQDPSEVRAKAAGTSVKLMMAYAFRRRTSHTASAPRSRASTSSAPPWTDWNSQYRLAGW